MAQKFLFLVKTRIFYGFSKWRKIEIWKPITEPQNLLKGNWLSVICDVKPGLWVSRVVTSIRAETMPERCVVFGCSNVQSKEKGILLHPILFYGKSECEKQKRRQLAPILWSSIWCRNFCRALRLYAFVTSLLLHVGKIHYLLLHGFYCSFVLLLRLPAYFVTFDFNL